MSAFASENVGLVAYMDSKGCFITPKLFHQMTAASQSKYQPVFTLPALTSSGSLDGEALDPRWAGTIASDGPESAVAGDHPDTSSLKAENERLKRELKGLISSIASVASAVGFQANEPAMEIAGQMVSVLSASPENVDRFIEQGSELFLDGTFNPENGSLTYRARNGAIVSPSALRSQKGMQQ